MIISKHSLQDFKTAVTEFKSAINSLSTKQYEAAIDFLTNARINATRAMENFQEKLNQSYDFIKITTCVQVNEICPGSQ